ncbi:MAG: ribose transport system ATP-binding protein [Erysipelotrichaceae bacterium]|nr:MAG: ribose transport system ATP-binding protein [Erysipelotrichaceae bacterium]
MNVLFGIDHKDGGETYFKSKRVVIDSASKAKSLGIGYVTENRKEEGLFIDFSISDNILFNNLKRLSNRTLVNEKKLKAITSEYTQNVRLKCRDHQQLVSELSGGNQQKVVLSKWLANNPSVLILDEPTRGIDVNAKKQIYELIFELKKAKAGIIIVSSELVELLGIADRIYVMREGRLMTELTNTQLTDGVVMNYMMGGEITNNENTNY